MGTRMSVKVYYDSYKDLESVLAKSCAQCGHALSYHGFTEHLEYSTGRHYLLVSQCVFCGEGRCKEFKESPNS